MAQPAECRLPHEKLNRSSYSESPGLLSICTPCYALYYYCQIILLFMKKRTTCSRRNFLQLASAGVLSLAALRDYPFTGHIDTVSIDEKKFVPVMITPFNSSGKIDFSALSTLIDFYIQSGAKGFFANCLSSEMYALTPEERISLAKHVVKHVNGSLPIVASGSFGQTMEERADFTKEMFDTGVNAVILITSHFADKTESDEVLIRNVEKFLSLTGNIPLGTYECPSPYKRIVTPPVFKYLLSTNRLIYHKDTTLDVEKVKEKLQLAKGSKLELYDAHAPNAMNSLQAGAKGISAIAGNFYPEIFSWLCKNANEPSREEDVKWIQSLITKTDPLISEGYPMSAKYFLQKRKILLNLSCRTGPAALTTTQKEQLDKLHHDIADWHNRLGLKTNDTN